MAEDMKEQARDLDNDLDRSLKVFAAQLSRAAGELKEQLSIDEMGFRFVAAPAHQSGRDYIVFETLDEIQKAVLAVFSGLELLSGEELDPEDPFTRISGEYLSDETSLWKRKLIELLTDLVAFSDTPDDEYFRDYLLLVQLDGILGAQRDQSEFYGSESVNYQQQIDEICESISALEGEGLDPERAWYRANRGTLDTRRMAPGRLLASFGARLRQALPLATPNEQGALGYSYAAGFGQASWGIHVRPGLPQRPQDVEKLKTGLLVVVVIGINLLVRCQETIGEVPDGVSESLRRSLEGSDVAIGKLRLRERAAVGDLVIVFGEVGKVLEVREGEYGYESYLVRYLSKPLMPSIPEDWHVAQEVVRLRTAQRIREEIQADIDSGRLWAEDASMLLDLDDEKLTEYYGRSFGELWDAGVGLKEAILDQLRPKQERATPGPDVDEGD